MKDNKEKFIEKARNVHGDEYNYSKVEYIDSKTKVCIICPEHGEFWQRPSRHVLGDKCPKCANTKRGKKRVSTNELITKFNTIHNNMYDYSKTEYTNANQKITVICPEHGEFTILPFNHLNGQGCPKCKGRNLNNNDLILKFKSVHGDKYDYTKVVFAKMKEKVCIICPEHGEFWQTPQKHLQGQGCPKCSFERTSKKRILSFENFEERAKTIYNNKYSYDKSSYTKVHDKVKITCPEHGEFWQLAYDHLNGHSCPKCGSQESTEEINIYNFLKEMGLSVLRRVRNIINPYELDLYIPEKKIAIEYNGIRWHSEMFDKDKNYHINKTLMCEKNGIRLIHIFEDEWLEQKELIKNKLLHILDIQRNVQKIYARKCVVKEIDKHIARTFLELNHIQGFVQSTTYIGCYYDNELVGVMSFKREMKNSNNWELTRFATDINKQCIGVGGKMLTFFIKSYNPDYIKSFADRRWTTIIGQNLYDKIGFKVDYITKPDYKYVIGNKRIHKFNCRKKHLLRKYPDILNENMTESEMTSKLGFYKIWDCGLIKYSLKIK